MTVENRKLPVSRPAYPEAFKGQRSIRAENSPNIQLRLASYLGIYRQQSEGRPLYEEPTVRG